MPAIDSVMCGPNWPSSSSPGKMRLTPEQQAQFEQARRDGRRSVHAALTEEQRADQQQKIAEEEELRDENIAAY